MNGRLNATMANLVGAVSDLRGLSLAYIVAPVSVLTGLGLGLLWTPADRLLLNPYRYNSVQQVCDLRGSKDLLGGEFSATRYDETVAGTVDIYSLCDTRYYSFPIPSIYPTAMFMLAILGSILVALVLLFRDKFRSRVFLIVPILLAGIAGMGMWQHSAMTEPNSKSDALGSAAYYIRSSTWSPPQLRAQLKYSYTNAEVEYAFEHLKVDWSLQAYRTAERLLDNNPDMTYKSLQSALLGEGHELPFIKIALTVMQLEENKN